MKSSRSFVSFEFRLKTQHIFSVCDDGCFAFVDVGGSVQRWKCHQVLVSIYTQGHVGLDVRWAWRAASNASYIAYTPQTDLYQLKWDYYNKETFVWKIRFVCCPRWYWNQCRRSYRLSQRFKPPSNSFLSVLYVAAIVHANMKDICNV